MLKIKDNVDLKELEKFGFKQISYKPCEIIYFKKVYLGNDDDDRVCYRVYTDTKFLTISRLDGSELDGTLYDLIKADLVEKI